MQQKCLNGPRRVVYVLVNFFRRFFNSYCALCSNVYVTDIECEPPRGVDLARPPLGKSFSIVMDLELGKTPSNVHKIKRFCREGTVYDFYLQACRPSITLSDVPSVLESTFSISIWMRSQTNKSYLPEITQEKFKELSNSEQVKPLQNSNF